MRPSRLGLFAFVLSATLPSFVLADAAQDCDKKSGDEAIRACTAAISEPGNAELYLLYYYRAFEYKRKDDLDRAIADYDQVIRLNPKYPAAFINRGNVYIRKGNFDRSIADLDQAISLDPEDAKAFYNRGLAYRAKGNLDRAFADYDQAIELNPKFDAAYLNRGITNLYAGSPPKALADLNQAAAIDPKYGYTFLWLEIAGRRSNLTSRLSQATAQINMTEWPAPVIRLFLGRMTPEAVVAAADKPDAGKKRAQICEANFYSGELAHSQGKTGDATRLLQLAADACPKDGPEWVAAGFELKAIGAGR
jgi:lipoprotein NlpI